MPTTAAMFEPRSPQLAASHEHARGSLRDDLPVSMTLLERTPATHTAAAHAIEGRHLTGLVATGVDGWPERVRRLIALHGSASALAERCGFSAGAVRSWRDGHSDISRERCVIMAGALGVSLLWLMVGEGSMRATLNDDEPSTDSATPASGRNQAANLPRALNLDSSLLAAALRLLQSYICLLGGSLEPATRAELLAELYGILARAEDAGHIDRLITFHNTLSAQLRRHRTPIS